MKRQFKQYFLLGCAVFLLTACGDHKEKTESSVVPSAVPSVEPQDTASAEPTETASVEVFAVPETGHENDIAVKIENQIPSYTIKSMRISSYGQDQWSDNILERAIKPQKTGDAYAPKTGEEPVWDIWTAGTEKGKEKTMTFLELNLIECESDPIIITLFLDDDGNPAAVAR